jgi:hypothetical protein
MLGVLRITFAAALRSVIFIFLPAAFICLITWATAGSASGNTADPIRAALWFFLVAHQIPLQLSISGMDASMSSSGVLSFLPIGALVIPVLSIRSGFRRVLAQINEPGTTQRRKHLFAFAINYSIIGLLISLPAIGKTVVTPFYLVIAFLLSVSFFAAFSVSGLFPRRNQDAPWEQALRLSIAIISLLTGIGSLVIAASAVWHFELIVNLTRVIEPGIFGGVALLLAQLIYLPNFAIGAWSYITGSGISVDDGSLISPFVHQIAEIPAIPILGTLPTKSYPILATAALINILAGVMIVRVALRRLADHKVLRDFVVITIGLVGCSSLLLARAAGGELISSNLTEVGPIWWLMPLLVMAELSIGAVLAFFLPRWFLRGRSVAKT